MRLKPILLLSFVLPLFIVSLSSGEIFLYKDENGVMHFSDTRHHPGFKRVSVGSGRGSYYTERYKSTMSTRKLHDVIIRISAKNSMDPNLVWAVIKAESDFNILAVSRKGAKGLMQLMPATAERFWVRDLFDPVENIRGGVRYLRELFTLYGGNIDYSLAAYNAGEGAVFKYKGIPPFHETQNYVKKVKRYYKQMKKKKSLDTGNGM